MSKATDCRKHAQIASAFWDQVVKTNSCWLWQGKCNPAGYGYTNLIGNFIAAHRLAYMLKHGSIPEKLFVLHKCDNPPCVRPLHLFTGTALDNVRDMYAKGRDKHRSGVDHVNARFKIEDIHLIRATTQIGDYQAYERLASAYNVSVSSIFNILHYRTYKDI